MKRDIYKIIDYPLNSALSSIALLLGSLFMIIISFKEIINGNNIYAFIIILVSGSAILIYTLFFGIKRYEININNKMVKFPRLYTRISNIKNITKDVEKRKLYLRKDIDKIHSYNSSPYDIDEYEESDIYIYTLHLSGNFGDKKYVFYNENNRDMIYDILMDNLTNLSTKE